MPVTIMVLPAPVSPVTTVSPGCGSTTASLMPPPTWALSYVSGFDTVEQLLAAERSISPILPDITPGAGLQGLSFPGSDDYFRTLGDQKPPEITL